MNQVMSEFENLTYPSLEHAQCPYPLHKTLLNEGGVHRVDSTGEYLVSRHADVVEVFRHPEIYSAALAREHARQQTGASTSAIYDEADSEHHAAIASVIETDPPEHKAKRELCFEGFKPGRLKRAEGPITEIVDRLIDAFADDGRVEFVSEFAVPLPILAFCSLFFGDPDEDYNEFARWATIEGSGLTYLPKDRQDAARARTAGLGEYLETAIATRYANPSDDVLSEMVRLQVDRDGELNVPYLQSEAGLLLAAGFVTTQHLISNTMLLLLRNPDVLAQLRREPAGIPRALEESLRVEAPVQWQRRLTSCDTELGGVAIPAGSVVLLVIGAANRDEARFDVPESFDPKRTNVKQHVAFGLGTHFCLGAPLSRMEGRIGFERLLARLSDIELEIDVDDIVFIDSPEFRGPEALPLRFSA